MKKGLFLLPLVGGLLLSGCTMNLFGKQINIKLPWEKESSDSSESGGDDKKKEGEYVELDFTDPSWSDNQITPYVKDNTTLLSFTYESVDYNDKGCFATSYDGSYYLAMKNKWVDGKVEENEEFAFIGNSTSYGKAIKSVEVEVSQQTGGVMFVVAFGKSAFTTSQTSGAKSYSAASSKSAKFTATCSDGSQYWSISATKNVGDWRKNGALAKVTIYF